MTGCGGGTGFICGLGVGGGEANLERSIVIFFSALGGEEKNFSELTQKSSKIERWISRERAKPLAVLMLSLLSLLCMGLFSNFKLIFYTLSAGRDKKAMINSV